MKVAVILIVLYFFHLDFLKNAVILTNLIFLSE